jgi:acetyl esterase/lipase
MGFSAGGHLASSVSTHFDNGNANATDQIDRVSSRPDFAVLGYPGHLADRTLDASGLEDQPARRRAGSRARASLSSETQVTASTPATFIYQTNADTTTPAENAVSYYLALRKAGVPAEMHIFKDGRHGSGLGMTDPALSEWPKLLANWMRASGFLK